jgi:hypothetical protein
VVETEKSFEFDVTYLTQCGSIKHILRFLSSLLVCDAMAVYDIFHVFTLTYASPLNGNEVYAVCT